MNGLFASAINAWGRLKSGNVPLPVAAPIPAARCRPEGSAGSPIPRDKMYFTVRISEMYLKDNRQWFSVYDPLAVAVMEFNHGSERVAVPAAIGPNLVQKQAASGQPVHGVLLLDTRVTGPHPYRGGDIDLSLSFYRVERVNYARTLLKVVETLSGAVAGAGEIAGIARTATALLEGVEGLLGLEETVYLAGQRISLATSPLDPFTSGFSALIAPPAPERPADLLVQDRRLFIEGKDGIMPYRDSDFVLLNIVGSEAREDENLFPFYRLKAAAIDAVMEGGEGIKRGKANLLAAYQQMRNSPDVTEAEARRLFDKWMQEFEDEMARAEAVHAMPIEQKTFARARVAEDLDAATKRLGL